ncbi:hypothetical protein ACP70R_009677 [Stipagrostis hirtigluma subsp. patula]
MDGFVAGIRVAGSGSHRGLMGYADQLGWARPASGLWWPVKMGV